MSDLASRFGGGTAEPDPLQMFLQRVVAWSLADPPDSFVNVHAWGGNTQFKGGGHAFGGPSGAWEAVNFVRYLNGKEAQVFFSVGAAPDYDRQGSEGKQHRKALRKAIVPRWMKAFGLDLDVKPRCYPSQEAARAAALAFLGGLGLKHGPIVNSGAGVHAYVTLDQPITVDRWRPLAAKLAAAAEATGLHFDRSCTVNAVGLWRMPTSTHRKDPSNPREVRVIDWGEDTTVDAVETALAGVTTGGYAAAAPPRTGLDLSHLPPRPPITGPEADRVRADMERAREATSFDLLRSVCGVVADSERRGGDGDIEPLWFELGKLMRFVQHGREWFHILSKGDPRYDPDQTNAKYDGATSSGWPRCATIAASSREASAICQRCPYLQLNQTPIHHARGGAVPPPEGVAPVAGQVNGFAHAFVGDDITYQFPPPGYKHTPEKLLLTSDDLLCFANPVLSIELIDEFDGKAYVRQIEFETVRGAEDGPPTHKFTVPYEAMTTAQEFRRACLKYGLTPLEPALKVLMPDLLTQMHNMRRVRTQQRMGWIETDELITGFSYGGQFHGPEGSKPTADPHQFYKPRGSLDVWKKTAGVFMGIVEMETIIATAFAAPLVRFTMVEGLIVFVRSSQSGEGKSASLETAASVWMSKQGMLTDGTMNATLARITTLNNLPLIFDEFIKDTSDRTAKQAAKAILSIAAGKQPSRLQGFGTYKEIPQIPSRTMMVGSSNISLVELAKNSDTNAQAARVLEIELSNVVQQLGITFEQATELKEAQERNSGVAGLVYAAYIGKNHRAVSRWIKDKLSELEGILGHRDVERFWVAAAATIIVGAAIATALGLLKFNVAGIQKYLVNLIFAHRAAMSDRGTNADDPAVQLQRVGNFLNDNIRSRIITAAMPSQGRARTPVLNPSQLVYANGYAVRWAKEERLLWLSEVKTQEWFKRNDVGSYPQLRTVLEKEGYCVRKHKRKIGGNCGEQYTTSPETVLEFDLSKECNANLNPPDDETGETNAV